MFEPRQIPPFVQNPFAPVLFNKTVSYITTAEQERLVQSVLNLTSSDSAFAQKALDAIKIILAGGASPIPVLNGLNPATKAAGSTDFLFECIGSGFDPTCVIYGNGSPIPTTFVSENKVTSTINLIGFSPMVVPVVIRNGAGVISNSMNFTITAVGTFAAPAKPTTTKAKKEDDDEEKEDKPKKKEETVAEKYHDTHGK